MVGALPKGAGPLTLCWLVNGWPSPTLLLGPGLLFRLVYAGRPQGEVHLVGGLRIKEGYSGKGYLIRAREVGLIEGYCFLKSAGLT